MTPKRKRVLDFIKSFTERNGYAPTLQEIGDHCGIVIATVHKHLVRLEEDGLLARRHNQARCIELVDTKNKQRILQLSPEWFESFHVVMRGCKPKPGAQLDMTGITLVART